MALVLLDRAQESATANTTVSFTLTGAQTGYQSLAGVGATNTTYYGATDGTNWEVGIGTYSTTGPTLTRTTILSSSNSNAAVSTFTSPLTVWVDYTASKAVTTDTLAYPPAIGGTTPAAGTFTTITGQTEVLKGTGSNLITYSQLIGGTLWTLNGTATAVTNSTGTTDPLGGNTASLISNATDVLYNGNCIYKAVIPVISSTPYTLSCYVKFGTATTVSIATRDNQSGTISSVTTTVATGWTRISTTITSGSTTSAISMEIGGANGTFYAWGAQVEIGLTANTYIPTTTTAVYGTPTLSFSGVSTLGLESNGALFLQPAGTGAIQAQATTSTTAGGNVRGANAVDWQTSRSGATRVASGAQSTVAGGDNNGATAVNSVVAGGTNNVASGTQSFIGSGNGNVTTNPYSNVIGGYGNTAAGYYNIIGGGYINSGTASAAVTTQSGTMNGTTAVTLSGSNASIKVGQYITGTSIAAFTYVAAISGTSLTLSQAASGSSTSTLSFYTPHGVVVGGGNNQATGSYSFIGGGGDAGTAANRNVASGDWSFVGGGIKNTASGLGSVVCGGGTDGNIGGNTASGILSTIVGGRSNNATGQYSFVYGGVQNTANTDAAVVYGGTYATTRSIKGNCVTAASDTPFGTFVAGQSQTALLVLARQTTDATPTVLASQSGTANSTNQVILPNNSAYYFKVRVIAGVTGAGNTKAWTLEGAIKRGANAASTAIVGTVTTTIVAADAGASTWTVTATADTTNGGLAITVTGQASTTIRWVAKAESTEMTF